MMLPLLAMLASTSQRPAASQVICKRLACIFMGTSHFCAVVHSCTQQCSESFCTPSVCLAVAAVSDIEGQKKCARGSMLF